MANDASNDETLKKLGRSVDLLVKLKLQEMRGDRNQKEMILFLNTLGCSSGEITEFLGAKAETVYSILSRARQPKKK